MTQDLIQPAIVPQRRDIVVIGGSSGSLAPLMRLLSDLDPNLEASVFIVQHRMVGAPLPVTSLASSTNLAVRVAENQARFQKGTIYLAPAGQHLMLTTDGMRVAHGPRENLSRPSIDVLFRSAAVTFGSRVTGVVLSGELHDGAAGLDAIRRCGGYTIVQDPSDAMSASLPRAALAMFPHRVLRALEIGATLSELANQPAPPRVKVPRDLELEARAAAVAMSAPDELSRVGEASHFTCPECQGPLWLMQQAPAHFRCDVGHAFSLDALESGQAHALERALWVAYRILAERSRLIEQMANRAKEQGNESIAADYTRRMHELHSHSRAVLSALESIDLPAPLPPEVEETS
ncbi:MAG: chemotaxis protein CheB [Myxococcota bacterium]